MRDGPPARIALIVDHPDRDLEGLTLVASELSSRGAEVFLVPMYAFEEVLLIRPHVVLLHYARPNNRRQLEACRSAGMRIVVLDTEGAVVRSVEHYIQAVVVSKFLVDRYCFWGTAQLEALPDDVDPGWAVVTGCPRFDFLSPRWRGTLPPVEPEVDRSILINTNFPVRAPRFQTPEKEREQMIRVHGWAPERVERLLDDLQQAFDNTCDLVIKLRARYPGIPIVVRPHPFESSLPYRDAFKGVENVHIRRDGSVFRWLRSCRVLVHHNCTTAVESIMLGKEPVMFDWVDTPTLDQPAVRAVSLMAETPHKFFRLVDDVIEGEIEIPAPLKEAREAMVRDWFLANDGAAHERVADVLMEEAAKCVGRPGRVKSGLGLGRALIRPSPKASITAVARWILGPALYTRLKGLTGKYRGSGKGFDSRDVQDVVDQVAGAGAFAVRPRAIRRVGEVLPLRFTLESIRVEALLPPREVGEARPALEPSRVEVS